MSIITLTMVETCLWFLLVSSFPGVTRSDINCLRSIKDQVVDPNEYLRSWVFDDETEGSICKFTGVTCWDDNENMVISIKLSNFGLTGKFHLGLKKCSGLQDLDLSRNNFSGPLPSNIDSLIQYVVFLDLSYNRFSGEIPASLQNITFLNTLMLQHNQFTGQIPPELALLEWLRKFSVADNRLTGPLPNFDTTILKIGPDSYDNNIGLDDFPDPEEEMIRLGKIGAAVGAAILAPIGAALGWFFFNGRKKEKQRVIRRGNGFLYIAD